VQDKFNLNISKKRYFSFAIFLVCCCFFASLGKYGLWKDFLEAGFRAVVRPELLLVGNVVWNRVIGLSCGAFLSCVGENTHLCVSARSKKRLILVV